MSACAHIERRRAFCVAAVITCEVSKAVLYSALCAEAIVGLDPRSKAITLLYKDWLASATR